MGEAEVKRKKKEEAFKERPETFVDGKDIIFCAVRHPVKGVAIMINQAKESEYQQALGMIQRRVYNIINLAEIRARSNAPKIELPEDTKPDDIIGGK